MYEHPGIMTAKQSAVAEAPYLARISDLADQAERSATYIESFINRCRTGDLSNGASVAPVPSGHFGQIDRLANALMEIDKLSRELQTIG